MARWRAGREERGGRTGRPVDEAAAAAAAAVAVWRLAVRALLALALLGIRPSSAGLLLLVQLLLLLGVLGVHLLVLERGVLEPLLDVERRRARVVVGHRTGGVRDRAWRRRGGEEGW